MSLNSVGHDSKEIAERERWQRDAIHKCLASFYNNGADGLVFVIRCGYSTQRSMQDDPVCEMQLCVMLLCQGRPFFPFQHLHADKLSVHKKRTKTHKMPLPQPHTPSLLPLPSLFPLSSLSSLSARHRWNTKGKRDGWRTQQTRAMHINTHELPSEHDKQTQNSTAQSAVG